MEPGSPPEQPSATEASSSTEKSSTGLDPNLAALLTYFLGFVSGIVFWVLEKKSSYVRFHALQSTFTFIGLSVLYIVSIRIPILKFFLPLLVSLAWLILWIILMVKAYQGERFKLPIVGDMAAERADIAG